MNHINGSVADKDRRIRKLQEELSILRRQVEGLRADYNNRFVAALNELGFDAEEITESGEIKFAVCLLQFLILKMAILVVDAGVLKMVKLIVSVGSFSRTDSCCGPSSRTRKRTISLVCKAASHFLLVGR